MCVCVCVCVCVKGREMRELRGSVGILGLRRREKCFFCSIHTYFIFSVHCCSSVFYHDSSSKRRERERKIEGD